jgi:hypothetical protein
MELKEIQLESVDWIYLAQDRDQWWVLVNFLGVSNDLPNSCFGHDKLPISMAHDFCSLHGNDSLMFPTCSSLTGLLNVSFTDTTIIQKTLVPTKNSMVYLVDPSHTCAKTVTALSHKIYFHEKLTQKMPSLAWIPFCDTDECSST